MSEPPLPGIQACVFDAYGTLFDYASAAARCRDVLGDKFERLSSLWREKQIQYTWLRTLEGAHEDFWKVTGDALDFAMATLALKDQGVRDRLMHLYLQLEAFPEVRQTLERVRAAGMKTAILSNGTPSMLKAIVECNRLGDLLDHVFSVEEVGVYKPHPEVYRLAAERLRMDRRAIAFLSANAWDASGASVFGLRVVWCNRYGQLAERLPGKPEFEVTTLAALPPLIGV